MAIVSKPATNKFRSNFDNVFGKGKKKMKTPATMQEAGEQLMTKSAISACEMIGRLVDAVEAKKSWEKDSPYNDDFAEGWVAACREVRARVDATIADLEC